MASMTPLEDMSYQATSYVIEAGNGLPALDVTANDPQGWVAQQVALRNPETPEGQAVAQSQDKNKTIQEIEQSMKDAIAGKIPLGDAVRRAEGKIGSAASGAVDAINPLNSVKDYITGGAKALVLVLVGVLLLVFGGYLLTKD